MRGLLDQSALDFDTVGILIGLEESLSEDHSPFLLESSVNFNHFLTSGDHFQGVLSKAQLRAGVFSRVAGIPWGLEPGVLEITHGAVTV